MPKQRFHKEEKYNSICGEIKKRKENHHPTILNVHIPGTGCRKDSDLPTYNAINKLRKEKNFHIPHIIFEGVGSVGWDYVPPAMCNIFSLQDEVNALPWYKKLFKFSWGVSTSDSEVLAGSNRISAFIGGIINGAGKIANTERIMNTLQALEEDGTLPEEIYLSGHSRGASNCIRIANAIYEKYGKKIKIHLCLTDPVPGDYKANCAMEEKIIPPNVATFTCVYAQDDVDAITKPFFVATDHTRLIFTNPQTIITSYSVKGDHNDFFQNVFEYGFEAMNYGANGKEYESEKVVLNPKWQSTKSIKPTEMVGNKGSCKEKQEFYKRTPIYSWLPLPLQKAIRIFRKVVEKDYDPNKDKTIDVGEFYIPDAKNEKGRKQLIKQLVHERLREKSQIQRDMLNTLRRKIIATAIKTKTKDCSYFIKLKTLEHSYSGYVDENTAKQFKIIQQAFKKAGASYISPEWEIAIEKIDALYAKSKAQKPLHPQVNINLSALRLDRDEDPMIQKIREIQTLIKSHDFKLYGGGTRYQGFKMSETAAWIMDQLEIFLDNSFNKKKPTLEVEFKQLCDEIEDKITNKIDQTKAVDNGLLLFNLGKTDRTTIELYQQIKDIVSVDKKAEMDFVIK